MKILYFTNVDKITDKAITTFLESRGHNILKWHKKITLDFIINNNVEFIVSDRARTLIKSDIIDFLPNKIINLHPGFLPWNRGYYPLYFSIKDKYPSGNTIHYIDSGIDTGDIIVQKEIKFTSQDTYRTAYNKMRDDMIEMFKKTWPLIELGKNNRKTQQGDFSHYWKRDFDGEFEKLSLGWDTPLNNQTLEKENI